MLQTKLQEEVTADLIRLGKFEVTVVGDDVSFSAFVNGNVGSGGVYYENGITINFSGTNQQFLLTSERGRAWIDKYGVNLLSINPPSGVECRVRSESFTCMENLSTLAIGSCLDWDGGKFNVKNVDTSHLTNFNALGNNSLVATCILDLSDFKNIANMTAIVCGRMGVYATGDIGLLGNSTSLTTFNCGFCNFSGSIEDLKKLTSLTTFTLTNSYSVDGSVNAMLDGMVANGRTSGTLVMNLIGTSCTYNGNGISSALTVTFSDSGWSVA